MLLCYEMWKEKSTRPFLQSGGKNNMTYVTIKKNKNKRSIQKTCLWFDVLEVTVSTDKALYLQDNKNIVDRPFGSCLFST